jgi:predicted P-loop ATPase
MHSQDKAPSAQPWGATPEDWIRWAGQLQLESELLPVVSDPNAKRSAKSNIKEPGKVPSMFNAAGEMVGVIGWPQRKTTDRDVSRWLQDSRLGICLQGRVVKAFDIDIADPVQAAAVADVLKLTLGALPTRGRPNSGKRLLAFRLPVDFPKRIIKTAHGNIELLSTGQQFIVCGTHPTGVRYEWDGGLPAHIPGLTMAEVDAAWQALADLFALPDGASEARNGRIVAAPRRASDMQDPRVSFLDENGWVTGFERDGKVNIRCPWEDGHSTDTGASSTTYFPAGVGGFAQGHFRCLHASCSARTDGDFDEATGYGLIGFDVVNNTVEPLPAFTRARNGQIEPTLNNLLMALRMPQLSGLRIAFDDFKGTEMVGAPGREWRPFTDNDYGRLQATIERGAAAFKPINAKLLRTAALLVAEENRFDSAIDWARDLPPWDGTPRAAAFFSRYMGAADTPYTRAVGRYLWSALAGRVLVPGVKADMMPTLIGEQGSVKTSAIEAMAPSRDTFVEINLAAKDDDIARLMGGKLLAEIAELRGLKTRDAESIKAWISRRVEEWVPKFKERPQQFARRCILIGTTNEDGFLDDATGERRHLPVRVGQANREAIEADRNQLWAEGIALFEGNGGEVLWREAYELAKPEHAQFKATDPWTDIVRDWLAEREVDGDEPRGARPVRAVDVLISGLSLNRRDVKRADEMRLGKVLRGLGYRKEQARVGGESRKVWIRESQA